MNQFTERIKKLREVMAEKNIDFYLIPTADDHSSEYVSDYYKVRNYFAGFTGSAGSLLIGREMDSGPTEDIIFRRNGSLREAVCRFSEWAATEFR